MSKTYLDDVETDKLERAATNLRDRLLVRLLARSGCRISEALALEVQHVDVDRATITILHLKSRVRLTCPRCSTRLGQTHAFCPKCGAAIQDAVAQVREHRRMRSLPLDKETMRMMREYLDRGGPVLRNGKQMVFGIGRGKGGGL